MMYFNELEDSRDITGLRHELTDKSKYFVY